MKQLFILLLPLYLWANYNPNQQCDNARLVLKEADMIYKKFDDPTNALNLLNAGAMRNITYREPACMDKKEYMKALEKYAFFISQSKQNRSFNSIENFIKKYPDNLKFKLYLAEAYENQFRAYKMSNYRTKALEAYKEYVKTAKKQKVKVSKYILKFIASGGLYKSKNSWSKYLNPDGSAPFNAFKVIYIDTKNPKEIVATQKVKDVAIGFQGEKLFNIDAANFGALWIGKVKFDKETKRTLYISQSQATARVIINGYVVYDGQNRGEVSYTFKKGVSTIEVEYLNRWHTVDFSFKMLKSVKKLTQQELIAALKPLVTKKTEFLYIGVYESEKKDSHVVLRVQKSKKPVVLMLQSQRAVIWEIKNPTHTKIQAVVINSSSPEATIMGDIKGVKVLYSKRRVGNGYQSGLPTKRRQNCQCISGHYTCGGTSSFNADSIPSAFNKRVRGFSGKYRVGILSVPELDMSDVKYQEIEAYRKLQMKKRNECAGNKNISPDELFK